MVELKPSWRKYHTEVKVAHPSGEMIGIDENIANLLAAMWAAGIETVNSCEAHVDDLVYVVLADLTGLQRFLSLVALGSLTINIMNDDIGAPDSSPEESWRWRYRLRPVHPNPNRWRDWRFIVSVEFPASHVPEVIRCLQNYGGFTDAS